MLIEDINTKSQKYVNDSLVQIIDIEQSDNAEHPLYYRVWTDTYCVSFKTKAQIVHNAYVRAIDVYSTFIDKYKCK